MAKSNEAVHPKARIVENFVVVWWDLAVERISRTSTYCEFVSDSNECLEFLRQIKDERIFIIASGGLGQKSIDELQKMRTIVTVYIFCVEKEKHNKWAKDYTKIKEVFTQIQPLYAMLKEDVRQSNSDLISFDVISAPKDGSENTLNDLDSSFMYSQLMKEILLEMNYGNNAKDALVENCHDDHIDSFVGLINRRQSGGILVKHFYTRYSIEHCELKILK